MNNFDFIKEYVENNIKDFHNKRIENVSNIELTKILKRKNPYLFKAKNVLTAEELIRGIVDSHISSNEETLFGNWLEEFAIFINQQVYGGWKSGITGIDLEFDRDGIRYLVSIKSGPNWANSTQLAKLKDYFKTATKTLRTTNSKLQVIGINGCCYGIENHPDKGDYFKYCGQNFWHFISGNENLYQEIIEPLGYLAKQRNDEFLENYAKLINRLTFAFSKDFCTNEGEINWNKIVELNSKNNPITL